MANQITVNSGTGNITVTTSRAVIGTVANVASANYANFAGEVIDPSQPNITSLGTLIDLGVSNTITTNNLIVTGNFSVGNLVANNANYANFAGNAFAVAGANVSGSVANATYAANAGFATTAGSANTANSATVANSANSVAGANVSGTVANATYADNAGNANFANSATVANSANSVTLANVSGAGNIASINLDGSSSNVLRGDGTFAPEGSSGNANYANFAGDVVNSTQSNITTLGTLTNVITSGQLTSTRAGNASDGGGQLYLNGSGNNRIDFNTNGTGAPTTTTRSSGTKVTLFPAISSTQTDYAMGIDAATMWSSLPLNDPSFKFKWYGNTTEIANLDGAGNFAVAGNISAVNINGNVANANYANYAGNAYAVDAANVSGLGNIATINLDGNVSNLLTGNGTFVAIPTVGSGSNISNGTSNVSVPTANGNIEVYANTQHWTFADNGNLILADGNGVIQSIANSSLDPLTPNASTMKLTPDQTYPSQALVLDPTTPGHIHLRAPGSNIDQPLANIYLGGEQSSFEVGIFNGAAPNLFVHSGNNTWGFDNAGNLTLPSNTFAINYANGTQVPVDNVANANYANFAGNAYSVDAANVSGLGNIATINLDGNASNFLDGTGNFVAAGSGANANYANFAGNAFSVDGANVVGAVANATYAANAGFATDATFANYVGYAVDNTSATSQLVSFVAPGFTANKQILVNGNFIFNPLSETLQVSNVDSTIIRAAQPNITSVGTLTTLNANTSSPISVATSNGNIQFTTTNSANTAGIQMAFAYNNTLGNLSVAFNGNNDGFGYYMANTAAGNVGTGNIRSYWQFLTDGTLRHTIGGSGNIIAKNIILGNVFTGQFNGNITAGNGNLGIGNITLNAAGIYTGNAAGLTNIPGANVTGTVANATYAANAGNANIANIAYSVSGANVSGTVANATYALNAGNANFANSATVASSANSVTLANVSGAGNIASINLNGSSSNVLYGNGVFSAVSVSTPNSIQNGNSIVNFTGVDGDLLISTNNITNGVQISGRQVQLNGANTGAGNISSINLINGALNWTLDNTIFSGGTPFGMNRYNSGFLEPLNYYTARGNVATPDDVQVGDAAYNERVQVRYNGATSSIFNSDVAVQSFTAANTVAAKYTIASYDDQANSVFQVNFGTSNIAGTVTTTGNVNVASGNVVLDTTGNITAVGRLDYLRTFGSFTSNATQTSNGANTTNYMTLNNTEDANGISIASSTQITVARTGRYNIQFSAQLEKTDSGTDIIEIWLDKNGTAVANSATRLELAGNGAKSVAAWDFNVNAANVNDYFRLAWASPDTAVQLTAITSANTISGVAVPSLIVDINPIGA